jgi:ribulose 1,5-bisphosphate synthetase/thiazole synthase
VDPRRLLMGGGGDGGGDVGMDAAVLDQQLDDILKEFPVDLAALATF